MARVSRRGAGWAQAQKGISGDPARCVLSLCFRTRCSRLAATPSSPPLLQVLRYANGQEYKPHFDYFFDTVS